MKRKRKAVILLMLGCLSFLVLGVMLAHASSPEGAEAIHFPRSLDSYKDSDMKGIGAILVHRIAQEPFNLIATLIFILAIVHTFMASRFLAIAHRWEEEHAEKIKAGELELLVHMHRCAKDHLDIPAPRFGSHQASDRRKWGVHREALC